MPRVKRTVGFWRGPTQTKKIALLPAPDRWTGTAVDGWPPSVLQALRRELLMAKRMKPDASEADLVRLANAWMVSNDASTSGRGKRNRKRKGGSGKSSQSVGAHHVRALLGSPARRSAKPKTPTAKPPAIDRAPRPTTLTGEELAQVMRRNQAATRTSRTPAPKAGRPSWVAKPARKGKQRKTGRTGKAGTQLNGGKPASKSKQRRVRAPLLRAAMRAGVSPRGPFVMWPAEVGAATRVRLDVRDFRRVPIRIVHADLAARYALFEAPAHGFVVTARFLDRDGTTVAEGNAEHRSPQS
jgi:hypothetical protein